MAEPAPTATCGLLANGVFVYLDDDASGEAVARLRSEISANEGVVTARLMGKRELRAELAGIYDEKELDQPLPPARSIPRQIRIEAADKTAGERVAATFASSPIVSDVAIGKARPCTPT